MAESRLVLAHSLSDARSSATSVPDPNDNENLAEQNIGRSAGLPELVAPQRHLGRWAAAVFVVLMLGWVGYSVYTNPSIDHGAISDFMFSGAILQGLKTTLILALLAGLLSIALGTVIALFRLSGNPVLTAVAQGYVWVFRGTPLLVQILILGNFSLFYPELAIVVPFTDITLVSADTNSILTMFTASVLALGLHDAAYMAEIIRSGIQSVDKGQTEASRALGLPGWVMQTRIVLPQALRVIIPPAGNNFINMLKMTSLVAVIAGGDLLTQAQNLSAANLKTIELLLVASAWYLIVVTVFSVGQMMVEKRLGRGYSRRSSRAAISLRLRRISK